MKNKIIIALFGFLFSGLLFSQRIFAEVKDDKALLDLSAQIIKSNSPQELGVAFMQFKDICCKEKQYSECVDFLGSIAEKKKTARPFTDYYSALCRYRHLKYLEEAQLWDEYFKRGNEYRQELTDYAQKVIQETAQEDALHLYARLLLWKFHADAQDVFHEEALLELRAAVEAYAKTSAQAIPLKEVADALFAYNEKGKAKEVYALFIARLTSLEISEESLFSFAAGFYKEGNLDLAEALYDIYLEKAVKKLPQEKFNAQVVAIAKEFMYRDEGQSDGMYAEKLFSRIEETSANIFDEELMYLRAFNLEKLHEFAQAKEAYAKLITRFPESRHIDEALFKAGIISAYVLKNKKEGKGYFEKLAQKQGALTPQKVSAWYHLGICAQWEEDFEAAKKYYANLLEKTAGAAYETLAYAHARLAEIEAKKPLEYTLKTFLDICFKEEFSGLTMSKVQIKAHPYRGKPTQAIEVSATAYTGETGCMQVELQYLWALDVGTPAPGLAQAVFTPSYELPGTKVLFLSATTPNGIIDYALDMVDIE